MVYVGNVPYEEDGHDRSPSQVLHHGQYLQLSCRQFVYALPSHLKLRYLQSQYSCI